MLEDVRSQIVRANPDGSYSQRVRMPKRERTTEEITLLLRELTTSSRRPARVQREEEAPPALDEEHVFKEPNTDLFALNYVDGVRSNNKYNRPVIRCQLIPYKTKPFQTQKYRSERTDFVMIENRCKTEVDFLGNKAGFCYLQPSSTLTKGAMETFKEHIRVLLNCSNECISAVKRVNSNQIVPDFVPVALAFIDMFYDQQTNDVKLDKSIQERSEFAANKGKKRLGSILKEYKAYHLAQTIQAPQGIIRPGEGDSFVPSEFYKANRKFHCRYITNCYDNLIKMSTNPAMGATVEEKECTATDIWLQLGMFTVLAKMLVDYSRSMIDHGFIEKNDHPGNQFRMYCIAKLRAIVDDRDLKRVNFDNVESKAYLPQSLQFFAKFVQLDENGFSSSCEQCQVAYLDVKKFTIDAYDNKYKRVIETFPYSVRSKKAMEEGFSEEFSPVTSIYPVSVEDKAPALVEEVKKRYRDHLNKIRISAPVNFTVENLKRKI